jgi:hypothetical protein
MPISYQIEGLDQYLAALAKTPEAVSKALRTQLKEEFVEIDRIARYNHNYTTRSGNLEKSIDWSVSEDGLSGTIWLSKTKSNAPYAWRIHEGFVDKYDVLGRHFMGPQPDQFLYKAVEQRKTQLYANMQQAMLRGFAEAGLA